MGATEVSKETQEFEVMLRKAINMIQAVQHKCLVNNFNLVEIQLPTDVYQALKQSTCYQCEATICSDDVRNIVGTYNGVRVVEIPYLNRPRYVIEGDLSIL